MNNLDAQIVQENKDWIESQIKKEQDDYVLKVRYERESWIAHRMLRNEPERELVLRQINDEFLAK